MEDLAGRFENLFSLRQLRCFLLVAEVGSIGRAADEIGLSQPGVSDSITRLEQQIGAPLLIRHKNGSAASSDGSILALRVKRLFAQLERGLFAVQPDHDIVLKSLPRLRMVHLRAHISIAEHGTFTRAAKHIGISGAALHRPARDLEQLIGKTLYRTKSRGIGVNAAGEILARQMRLALHEIVQANEEIGHRSTGAPARITAGILPLVPKSWTARVIARTKALHPGANIDLREGDHAVLLRALQWGAIDVIAGALPPRTPEPETMEEPLFADPYVLVVRRGHPLEKKRKVTLKMLTNHDWVAPSRDLPRRAALERFFSILPARPRIWLDTNSPGAMMAVLAETDCIALISRAQLQLDGPGNLVVLPVETRGVKRIVGITRRQDWLPTPVQLGFLEALRETHPVAEDAVS